ncbi:MULTISPECIES: metallo-hydrolase/oxidoreductase [unclassified Bradyrhizobium]|uniref:metallo-hydrolase/oxidoreductase n=1 Tax=unclassified Bradyrhizobium TaxID=2631580 RepID=UPI0028ECA1E9|nr:MULTISPECIES: metallo-hydrolase/oxidoreductase [unclassified Bradyrhizobium]
MGDWFVFSFVDKKPKHGGLPVWRAPLGEDGFVDLARTWIGQGEKISDDREPHRPPRSLGAAALSDHTWAQGIKAASVFPAGAIKSRTVLKKILEAPTNIRRISVRDVGQASYACLRSFGGSVELFYDVGWPLPFNRRTEPKRFFPDLGRAPVVISHWDWDHLCFCLKKIGRYLLECNWIAPVQKLGPGAARIAHMLHKKGRLYSWKGSAVSFGVGRIGYCSATPSDANNSGLALKIQLSSKASVLLVGDADYQFLPSALSGKLDGLVVTHHGARFGGSLSSVPQPTTKNSKCVISFGRGNTYKHPHADSLRLHRSAGWQRIETTAGSKFKFRSDKHFY